MYKRATGFTLIELMIVVLIISIAATFAVLNMRHYLLRRQTAQIAAQLQELMEVAKQQAILQPAVLGVRIEPHSYRFYQFTIDKEKNIGRWQALTQDRIFKRVMLPASITLSLKTDNNLQNLEKENEQAPQIVFTPSGDIERFHLLIQQKGAKEAYELIGAVNGVLQLKSSLSS